MSVSFVNNNFTTSTSQVALSPTIFDQNHFRGITPGFLCFFSHIRKLSHLVISKMQEWFYPSISPLGFNLTHVGIVQDIDPKHESFRISNIPQIGESISMSKVTLDDLKNHRESLLFVSPEDLVDSDRIGLNPMIRQISRQVLNYGAIEGNQYNLLGAIMTPVTSNTFTKDDLKDLIESLIVYLHPTTKANKKYFCSEFVMQHIQLGRLIQRYPETIRLSKAIASKYDMKNSVMRSKAIAEILQKMDERGDSKKILEDSVFQKPSRAVTPATLFDMFLKRNARVIRVKNSNAQEYVLSLNSQKDYLEFFEFLLTQIFIMVHGNIPLDDAVLRGMLSKLEQHTHYNQETLRCFLSAYPENPILKQKIERCIQQTESIKGKLTIFMMSRFINRYISRILSDPDFLYFVQLSQARDVVQFVAEHESHLTRAILDKLFPIRASQPIASVENYFAKKYIQNPDLPMLVKYLPLALAYDPPIDVVRAFVTEHGITLENLAQRVMEFLLSK